EKKSFDLFRLLFRSYQMMESRRAHPCAAFVGGTDGERNEVKSTRNDLAVSRDPRLPVYVERTGSAGLAESGSTAPAGRKTGQTKAAATRGRQRRHRRSRRVGPALGLARRTQTAHRIVGRGVCSRFLERAGRCDAEARIAPAARRNYRRS